MFVDDYMWNKVGHEGEHYASIFEGDRECEDKGHEEEVYQNGLAIFKEWKTP